MFEQFQTYLYSYTLLIPFIALLVAIVVKGVVHAAKWRFSFSNMLGSGGMPSAHSTFVIALATSMGIKYGPWSDMFLICLVFSIIIIYDECEIPSWTPCTCIEYTYSTWWKHTEWIYRTYACRGYGWRNYRIYHSRNTSRIIIWKLIHTHFTTGKLEASRMSLVFS